MKERARWHVLLLAAALGTATGQGAETTEARMARFREAKFGMFIHWGLYAIPARGEWVMNRSKIPVAKYAEYAAQFNPVKFSADEWVRVAKDAGMKYIVITSKHHDGFAMFGSKVSPYNIVDATPFKRDPLKELAAACRKEGLGLGFYYSQAQDWHHPGGAASGGHWDPAQRGDFDQYLRTIAMPQVKELLANYGPVFSIWFDTPVQMTPASCRTFADLVHAAQPATLINSRLLHSGRSVNSLNAAQLAELKDLGVDYLSYADRQIPAQPHWRDWETCMTLNRSWGYNQSDNDWKSPGVLILQLVEIASKGGNFLLNVGPTAEGEIPAPSVRNLKEVGRWLKVNGEAIYGAGPSPLAGPPGAGGAPAWRCTAKPGKLFVHVVDWPGEGRLEIPARLGVSRAYLLADPGKALKFTADEARTRLELPPAAPDPSVSTLCIELEEKPPAKP